MLLKQYFLGSEISLFIVSPVHCLAIVHESRQHLSVHTVLTDNAYSSWLYYTQVGQSLTGRVDVSEIRKYVPPHASPGARFTKV
jgi:hypothetical protein